jgi:hypothetical protein
MTNDVVKPTEINGDKLEGGVTGKGFKPGYDPRRWMKGRGKKSPTMKEAEKIFGELIWDILSEEIENPITHDKVDRFRAMLRSMITSRQSADKQTILDRILGKVAQGVELTGKDGGELKIKGFVVVSPDDWDKIEKKDG